MTKTLTGTIANGVVTLDRPADPTLAGRVTITVSDSSKPASADRGEMLRFGMFPELRSLDVEAALRDIRDEARKAFDRKWGSAEAGN